MLLFFFVLKMEKGRLRIHLTVLAFSFGLIEITNPSFVLGPNLTENGKTGRDINMHGLAVQEGTKVHDGI